MPRQRCAILDDYQNVVLTVTDWSKVSGDLDIKVFNQHLGSQDNVIKALQGFDIVCAMRERTAFPRAVIEKLPDLKLLITTGLRNASIDVAAAKERGVVVCGTPSTGNPTSGIAIGLMLELTRRIGYENARMKAGVPWQFGTDDPEKLLERAGFQKVLVVQPAECLPQRWPFPSLPRGVPGIPRSYLVTAARM